MTLNTENEAIAAAADKHIMAINRFKEFMRENPRVPFDVKNLGQMSVAYDGLWDQKYRKMLDLLADLEPPVANKKQNAFVSPSLARVRKELEDICAEVAGIVRDNLLWYAVGDRERALIYKLKGDYCRNNWKINSDRTLCEEASKSYMNALAICKWNFVPSDTCLLKIALIYTEHLNNANNPDEAIAVLTGVIRYAEEDIAKNNRVNKPFVETILKELKNVLACSRESSNLRLTKLLNEQLDCVKRYPARH